MKTIIIPTDYSDNAFHAAEHGFALARQLGAQVLLFHAFHLPETNPVQATDVPSPEEMTARHLARLEKTGRQLKEKYPVHLEYAARMGFLLDELKKLVESTHADLVVMGRRGENPLEEKIFGSAATAVLRQAAFPVLIVPLEAQVQPIQRIIFACDYAALTPDNSLALLKEIAGSPEAQVQVLHMARPQTVLVDGSLPVEGVRLDQLLHGVNHQLWWMEEENITAGIEQSIASHGADLLVMVPRKRSFWEQLTDPSETRRMALKTSIPLLALPNPEPAAQMRAAT